MKNARLHRNLLFCSCLLYTSAAWPAASARPGVQGRAASAALPTASFKTVRRPMGGMGGIPVEVRPIVRERGGLMQHFCCDMFAFKFRYITGAPMKAAWKRACVSVVLACGVMGGQALALSLIHI